MYHGSKAKSKAKKKKKRKNQLVKEKNTNGRVEEVA